MLFLSFFVTYFSLHNFFPPHILCMHLHLFLLHEICSSSGICHQNIKLTFTTIVIFKERKCVRIFKTIFSWYTYISWRVAALIVRKCWGILAFFAMSSIFSDSWIWSTQAVSQQKLQYCFVMPDILCLVNTDSCGWVFLITMIRPFPFRFTPGDLWSWNYTFALYVKVYFVVVQSIIYAKNPIHSPSNVAKCKFKFLWRVPHTNRRRLITCHIYIIAHLYTGYLLFEELNSPSCFLDSMYSLYRAVFHVPNLYLFRFWKTIMQIWKHHSRGHIIPVELLDDTRLPGYGDCHS